MSRYQIYIYDIEGEKSGQMVYDGDAFDKAVANFNDDVKRSQGEWANYVFIGKEVILFDSGMIIRRYNPKGE